MEQHKDLGHQAAPSGSVPSAYENQTFVTKPMRMVIEGRSSASALIATVAGIAAGMGYRWPQGATAHKARKPVPRMVCSPPEEIAAWNSAVEARKSSPSSKVHRKYRGDSGQHPKFAKERARKQHNHALRDKHGAYTLVGRNPITKHAPESIQPYMPRRKWLAGISAQRGY